MYGISQTPLPPLPYDPKSLSWEIARHDIPAPGWDIQAILRTLGMPLVVGWCGDEVGRHRESIGCLQGADSCTEALSYETVWKNHQILGISLKCTSIKYEML